LDDAGRYGSVCGESHPRHERKCWDRPRNALAFAKQRAQVVISGRRETDGEAVIPEIKESGGEEIFVKTDVSKEGDISSMIRRTLARFGSLDCAFSAGIEQSLTRPLLSISSTVSVEDECDRESRGRSSHLSWW